MPKAEWSAHFPESSQTILSENQEFGFQIVHIEGDNELNLTATSGLSDYEQPSKGQHEAYKRVELYFSLPPYVNPKEISWPQYWLNILAQLPQKNSSWYGPGDTIKGSLQSKSLELDEVLDKSEVALEDSEYAAQPADHFILAEPFEFEDELFKLEDPEVRFLAVIPIFEPELDFKIRNSGTALILRLRKKGFSERIDTYRTSVCRKRILGF